MIVEKQKYPYEGFLFVVLLIELHLIYGSFQVVIVPLVKVIKVSFII